MKKVLFFILLAFICQLTHAQKEQQDEKHVFYCELMGYNFWGIGKVKVMLDMGKYTNTKGFDTLYQPNGKQIKFNTTMGALNYMGERGWKCIGTYYVSVGSQNVVHFLLEKYVKDESEIKEGLILKEDVKKSKDDDDDDWDDDGGDLF